MVLNISQRVTHGAGEMIGKYLDSLDSHVNSGAPQISAPKLKAEAPSLRCKDLPTPPKVLCH